MVRLLVGALLASVVLFGWGFLFWEKSPLRYAVLKPVPNNETVVGVLQKNLPESGVYLSPFADESGSREDRETAEKELREKHRQGPRVEVIYRKEGIDPISSVVFGVGFAHMFLSSLLIGLLLKLALPGLPSYSSRVLFVFVAGVFSAVWVDLSTPIWFHHPWGLPLFNALYHASSWFLAGLILGAVLPPRA
jgi:hypothetical protein